MANTEKTEKIEKTEKRVIVGINVNGKNFNHKAKHAMVCLRNEVQKHFRTTNFVISTEINKFVWSEGRSNSPTKIPLIGITKNDKVYLFLDGSEADKNNMDVVLGKAVKEDPKEKRKQETKEEHKEHKKEDVHKKQKDFVGAKEKKTEKRNQEAKKEKEKKGIK